MPKGAITWSWRDAAFGAVISAVGFIVIATGHPETGLPLLVGSLPGAVIGLLPTRQARRKLLFVAFLFALFILIGSFMAQWSAIAIIGMGVLAYGAAILASYRAIGSVALTLCVPLAGVGLSYAGLHSSIGLALLILAGSIVAYLWSLLFPDYAVPKHAAAALLGHAEARSYGMLLALTAASATTLGYLLGAEHVGWIAGAALFVMRPVHEMQELRSVGRIISVFTGALVASWLLSLHLSAVVAGLLAALSLILAAATHKSRWYITPAFTTFLVFWVLLYGQSTSGAITFRFVERVADTLMGVTIAYIFGLALPAIIRSSSKSSR